MGEKSENVRDRCAREEQTRTPGYDPRDLEYVKAMLDYVRDDARQDYLRVTAALALAAIFVTQVPIAELRRLDHTHTVVLFAGLGCLVLAATAYFTYVQSTHLARRRLSGYLLTLDTNKVKCCAHKLFRRPLRRIHFHAGNVLFLAGVALLADVLWVLVDSSP
jgi:hypothetical protein